MLYIDNNTSDCSVICSDAIERYSPIRLGLVQCYMSPLVGVPYIYFAKVIILDFTICIELIVFWVPKSLVESWGFQVEVATKYFISSFMQNQFNRGCTITILEILDFTHL